MEMELAVRGPVAMRRMVAGACEVHDGHTHNYDHVTLVIRGRIRVRYRYEERGTPVEGETAEFGPGETVEIRAAVYHEITALEDGTVYVCIFSHRDFDGVVVERYVGNQRAYL